VPHQTLQHRISFAISHLRTSKKFSQTPSSPLLAPKKSKTFSTCAASGETAWPMRRRAASNARLPRSGVNGAAACPRQGTRDKEAIVAVHVSAYWALFDDVNDFVNTLNCLPIHLSVRHYLSYPVNPRNEEAKSVESSVGCVLSHSNNSPCSLSFRT